MKNKLKSEWIVANAGSGKTSALTERVVRLLLLGVPAEHLVCITYTKAAAAEMHDRVLKRLRELLLMGDAALRERCEKLLGATPSDEVLAHARTLFGRMMDSPAGGVMLTTIHGFCQHLLRRFPFEAGVSPHFSVLEESAQETLIARVKQQLLRGIETKDAALHDALVMIGERAGEYGFEQITEDCIANRRHWQRVWRGQSAESLRAAVMAYHGIAPETTREGLAEALCHALTAAQEAALRAQLAAMQTHKKKTEQKYATGLAQWLEVSAAERSPRIDALLKLMLTEGALRADVGKLEQYAVVEPLAQAVLRYQAQLAALACAEESMAVALLARAMLDLYATGKAQQQALDYDDLIDQTLQLLAHPQTLGWVMSKLDHRIDHLLIDEAQDNSGAQWQLAQVLVEELIASTDGVGSAGVPRSVLVVGDEKQSIYSFQGAAPEQFQANRTRFHGMLAGSNAPMEDRALETSYRSSGAVMGLVNQLCATPAIAAALSKAPAIAPHQFARTEAAGKVVLYPPVLATEKPEREALVLPTEYQLAERAVEQLAEQIASTVAGWVQREKRLRAGDILILVHKRKPMVAPLIRALERHGVPVAGIDRLALSEHLAVRDLLALMAWLLTPTDDLALAQVLRSPLIGISDDQLRGYAYGRTGSLWQAVQQDYPWLHAARGQRHTTPYDFLTWVLEVSVRRVMMARRFGEEVHEVLDELKAQACAMPAERAETLAQFYDWMSKSTRQIKREQEHSPRDEVRIMTAHGSKGLEAPVVVLADTVSVPTTQHERSYFVQDAAGRVQPVLAFSATGKDAPRLEAAKERKKQALYEEYLRLMYVAVTRARDELHVFGQASKKGEVKAGAWYALLADAMRAVGNEQADGCWVVEHAGSEAPTNIAKNDFGSPSRGEQGMRYPIG